MPIWPGGPGITILCNAGAASFMTELQPEGTRSDLLKYPPGTLLNEIYTSWRWPIVTGKIEHNPRNPLEYAKIYRMTQARTRKPVKFGTVSGQVMALFAQLSRARISD